MTLERHQVWLYLLAIVLGLLVGTATPEIGPLFETLLWPVLVLLLFVTFMQVPLLRLRDAFRDHRFVAATLVGNFILLPLVVWGLIGFLPDNDALRLGVLLVLLVPCTDWFITFSQLGGGDTSRAITITPLNLVLQLALLPVYLWVFFGRDAPSVLALTEVWSALLVILIPLLAAALIERWLEQRPRRPGIRARLGVWPVPLLALVVFLIAAAQVQTVVDALGVLPLLIPLFGVFLLIAAPLAKLLARLFALPPAQGRTLAFSLGTRNSFIVLPFALALPAGWELAAVVIVVQSLVELFGMVFYLWWVPRKLFP